MPEELDSFSPLSGGPLFKVFIVARDKVFHGQWGVTASALAEVFGQGFSVRAIGRKDPIAGPEVLGYLLSPTLAFFHDEDFSEIPLD